MHNMTKKPFRFYNAIIFNIFAILRTYYYNNMGLAGNLRNLDGPASQKLD